MSKKKQSSSHSRTHAGSQAGSQSWGAGVVAAWAACGCVLLVLAFLFGTMVNDGAASGTTATASTMPAGSPAPSNMRRVTPDAVPNSLRESVVPPSTGARAPVVALPAVIDLGTIGTNLTVPATTELRNTGTEPITIKSTRANCGCTTVDMAGTVIAPGRSVPLEATYKSPSASGPRSSAITVVFDGYPEPLTVNISANVQGCARLGVFPRCEPSKAVPLRPVVGIHQPGGGSVYPPLLANLPSNE